MTKTPRQRAEACFAVARSTTHDGEREAAIGRGRHICKANGLDLDDFDIPGRVRTRPAGGMRGNDFDIAFDTGFTARESAFSREQSDLFAAAARAQEAIRRQAEALRQAEIRARNEKLRRTMEEAAERATKATREFHEAADRAGSVSRQCPTCGHYKHESRFGAPCYDCVPATVYEETPVRTDARDSYAPFHEFGGINRPERPSRPFYGHATAADACPKCGGERRLSGFFAYCPSCDRP